MFVPNINPESTCQQRAFKNPSVFILLKVLGFSAHNLTVSKHSSHISVHSVATCLAFDVNQLLLSL